MKLLLIDRPLDKDIISGREVEFFGPWAQPIDSPENLAEPVFKPYASVEAIPQATGQAIKIADEILDNLIDLMPGLTGINKGRRFWRFLLAGHVIVLTNIIEDIKIRQAALPQKDYILGLPAADAVSRESIPHSWNDAIEYIFSNDRFRQYAVALYLKDYYKERELIKYADFSCRKIEVSSEDKSVNPYAGMFKKSAKRLSRFIFSNPISARLILRVYDRCFISLICDRYHLRLSDLKKMGAIPFFKQLLPDIRLPVSIKADIAIREKIKEGLAEPYGELLSLSLPIVALEGLGYLVKFTDALDLKQLKKIERVYTHGQIFWEPEGLRRTLLAQLVDEGKKIVSIQHGGSVTCSAHSSMFLDRIIADEYISWGNGYSACNELPKANKIRFLPSIYLSRLKMESSKNSQNTDWEALFVVLEEQRYIKWFYNPLFPDMAHDYFNRQKILFDYFGKKEKVAVKVYPEAYGWKQADWIKSKYPNLNLLVSGRFIDRALRSRMLIVDYSSTAFLESVVMKRPFLATWNRQWFRGADLFEKYMDKLSRAGIFYEDPAELLRAYIGISSDINGWWDQPDKRDALEEMASSFALTSDNVYGLWRKELR